ncbi:MAG: hypothetical protein M3N47_14910 [Chloroflexota bacterium]|nr:hypothetical protein [Chloroflexota bacterium]
MEATQRGLDVGWMVAGQSVDVLSTSSSVLGSLSPGVSAAATAVVRASFSCSQSPFSSSV